MKYLNKLNVFIAILVLLVLLIVSLTFRSFAQIEATAEARKNARILMSHADDLLSALKDAETGYRGYLLTGNDTFLETYLVVRDKVSDQLKELRERTLIPASQTHLDRLRPLLDAKMAEMARVIMLHKNGDKAAATAAVSGGHGKKLMDLIRGELRSFTQLEESVLLQREAEFRNGMRKLFAIVAVASLMLLFLALAFAYLIYKKSEQRLKDVVHLETERLLKTQEDTNKQLQLTNDSLQVSQETTQMLVNKLEIFQIELEEQNTNLRRTQHELETQQIELELQNDELRLSREGATQLETVLRDKEERLAVTLNSIGDGVISTDVESRVILLNPVAEQLTGWTQDEAFGKPVAEIFHIVNKETRQPAPIPVMNAILHGKSHGLANHTVLIARDGTEYDIADSCAPIRNPEDEPIGAVLIFRNVTDEYAVQQSLRDSSALTQTILNTVVDGVITIHATSGLIETVNPSSEQMFGYTSAELYGETVNMLIPELDQDQRNGSLKYFSASEEALASSRQSREVMGKRKDGSFFPLEFAASEMWLGGKRYFTGILRDISARKLIEAERVRLEQILQAKNIELERATLVAEKANLAKSDFLSSMSHELRTPLSAILGFAQLIESGIPQPTPNQKRSIDQILKAGWYLLELINEILDLELIESGKLSMSLEPISLPEVMHECERMIEPEAIKHAISITFADFAVPCFIEADRTRVKQVLINLLSNAIKYNRAGGTVLVESVVNGTESVRINVRDTGAGLSSIQLTQLFQPFNRLGQESGSEQGTGIGLVVSKRLVELMGGVIGVESTVGVGSIFWIEMKLMAKPHAPVNSSETVAVAVEHKECDELTQTLLYVEDNPANMMLVEDIIARRPDIRLLTARDGKSGIELARSLLPDVILMDINLPGISGIAAMKILAVDHTTAHIPGGCTQCQCDAA